MATALLVFALLMASASLALVLWSLASEVSEAWDIARHGWAHGHHHHRVFGPHA